MQEPKLPLYAVREIPLFARCQQDVLQLISSSMKQQTYNSGDFIVKKGETGNEMYFIVDGFVEIISGDALIVDYASAGSFFGELSLLSEVPRTASVRVSKHSESCTLFVLQREDFNVVKEQPEIIEQIQQIADKRFDRFKSELRTIGFGNNEFTQEQLNGFRQVFSNFDKNDSNTLDASELGNLLERLSGKIFSNRELKHIMAKFTGSSNKSELAFDEFIAGLGHFAWLADDNNNNVWTKDQMVPEPEENDDSFTPLMYMAVGAGIASVVAFAVVKFSK